MKLYIAKKCDYDEWIEKYITYNHGNYYELNKHLLCNELLESNIDFDKIEIELDETMLISEIILLLTGKKQIESKLLCEVNDSDLNEEIKENYCYYIKNEESFLITETYLYCYRVSSTILNENTTLKDYRIMENDILVIGNYQKIEPDIAKYCAIVYRDLTDLRNYIRLKEDILNSKSLFKKVPRPKGYTENLYESWTFSGGHTSGRRSIDGLILYTDEDVQLAKYIRENFSFIDKMSGCNINYYIMESPRKINGASIKDYWTGVWDENKYKIFNMLCFLNTIPYDKTEIYSIIDRFKLQPSDLPCIVFFDSDNIFDNFFNIKIESNIVQSIRHITGIAKLAITNIQLNQKLNINFESFKNELFISLYKETPLDSIQDLQIKLTNNIHEVCKSFERLPKTYSNKDEETLRDHILVSLQANTYISATGETFNKKGKTDILIRYTNKNIVIGECKIWKGEKLYIETINQILRYMSWRDDYGIIIIFVRNKSMAEIVNNIASYTSKHTNYIKYLETKDNSIHKFLFSNSCDNLKNILLTVMLYHIPD